MIEKTLRYPGCIEYLRVLRDTGFFSYEEIDIKGHKIKPIDVTAKLLFPKWKLQPGEEEFTIMRIKIEGEEDGVSKSYTYNLHDKTDRENGTLSMARTTGYTCTAVAHLVIDQKFKRVGICPPEFLGEESSHFDFIVNYLKQRNVHYRVVSK
jgi:saccharopine dehydrogenase-like NADP-dependent oxidoreductase